MTFALENSAGLDREGRRFDIAYYSGVTEELDALGGMDITKDASINDGGRYDNIRLELSSFAQDQSPCQRMDQPFRVTMDLQGAFESEFTRRTFVVNRGRLRCKILVELPRLMQVCEPDFKVRRSVRKKVGEFARRGRLA